MPEQSDVCGCGGGTCHYLVTQSRSVDLHADWVVNSRGSRGPGSYSGVSCVWIHVPADSQRLVPLDAPSHPVSLILTGIRLSKEND